MTMLPITYGYARVSRADDSSKNLDTQLRLLAGHGIRKDPIFADVASGRRECHGRRRPGGPLVLQRRFIWRGDFRAQFEPDNVLP